MKLSVIFVNFTITVTLSEKTSHRQSNFSIPRKFGNTKHRKMGLKTKHALHIDL